jgi:phosphate/sulfate permease
VVAAKVEENYMLTQLLFETPWWLPTSLIGVGIIIFLAGNRRQEKKILIIGIVLVLLGITNALVSYFVMTDMEKVVARTKQLVASVNARDWNTFSSLLDPQTSLDGYHNRDQLVAGAKLTADRIGLKSVRITGYDTEKHDTLIIVNIRALSEQDVAGATVTDWQLQWQNFGNGWLLYNIQPLTNAQVHEEDIEKRLVHP